MTHSITLVSHALCPYVQRIAIVLAEKGVPHERITVDLAAKPDCPAYLIRGHGVYCWSDDLDSCLDKLEAVEFLLQCELERRRLHPGQHTGEKQ